MIRWLILLLALVTALPATAAGPACHPPGVAIRHDARHHAPAPDLAPPHQCVGCIPPAMLLAGVVPAPLCVRAPLARMPAGALAPLDARAPIPPPPRIA